MSHLSVEAVAHSGRSHYPRLLITGKGNSSCDGILIKSTAASAPHPRAHGMKEDDKQGSGGKESVTREQHIDGPSSKALLPLEDRVKSCRYISLYVLYAELSSTVKVCPNIRAAVA